MLSVISLSTGNFAIPGALKHKRKAVMSKPTDCVSKLVEWNLLFEIRVGVRCYVHGFRVLASSQEEWR